MNYACEAQALDRSILDWIDAWTRGQDAGDAEFNELALRIFAFQARFNAPYGKFAAAHGFDETRLPKNWDEIPAAPSDAFKDATLATFDVKNAALRFQTSGTTTAMAGTHYMESPQLYDAALLAGFDRYMLGDTKKPLRYVMLVPDPKERSSSSLGYMMGEVERRRAAQARWYLHDEALDAEGAIADLLDATRKKTALCIATTAFALVHLLDACALAHVRFELPPGSRIMETGGFKGRSRIVERDELYARAAAVFGINQSAIVAEYGMTELTSQYYDSPGSRNSSVRVKAAGSWLRTYAVDLHGKRCAPGEPGRLVHVDLANRSSVLAVATEDLGYSVETTKGDERLVLIGRPSDAPLRGCSLDAETLDARAAR